MRTAEGRLKQTSTPRLTSIDGKPGRLESMPL